MVTLFEIGSKRALSEDFGSFSMSTNPRRALIEGALSEDLVYYNAKISVANFSAPNEPSLYIQQIL